jgi:hypothetical protein
MPLLIFGAALDTAKSAARQRRQCYARAMPSEREILYEFIRIGHAMKVIAIDAATGIEATIVGDPSVGEPALRRLARQKLDYVMARRGRG